VLGIGFSSTSWNGVPLPAPLTPVGGLPGCRAFNNVIITHAALSSPAGAASFPISLPGGVSGIGFEYLSQLSSLGPSALITTNSYRSIVGL
jgi:hypothetical protein